MNAARPPLNADLHCHSNRSDGTLEPAELVRRAHEHGVRMLALTDHDELGGLPEAAAQAARLGLRFVPGVEVSVSWGNETVHVVGLEIDPTCTELIEGLARTRAGRDERAREMAAQLDAAGIPGAYEGACRHVANPQLISRTHFARFLVDQGVCRNVGEVFERYLSEGRPGHVPHRWATLAQAIGWIRAAGGTAVLAHPGRYRLGRTALHAMIEEFRALGGEAIEVVCGSHSPWQYDEFARCARAFRLRASRGSDFHGPGESRVELGALPPLPDDLIPVWQDWH